MSAPRADGEHQRFLEARGRRERVAREVEGADATDMVDPGGGCCALYMCVPYLSIAP